MIKKLSAWLSVAAWMGLIFQFSAQNADQSSSLSQGLTKILYNFISRIPLLKINLSLFHKLLRQAAHFFIFFVLALLLLNAFRISGINFKTAFLFTIIIAVFYAGLDEYHQSFVPGRAAEIKDVAIDSLGALVGVGVYRIALLLLGFSI